MNKKVLKKLFKSMDDDGSGEIDYNEFITMIQKLQYRPEVEALAKTLGILVTADPPTISAEGFAKFLHENQGVEGANVELVMKLAESQGYSVSSIGNIPLSVMSNYLFSNSNEVYDPTKLAHYQDMSQPMSHYFVNSSHNTYLEGDQLFGKSSANAYINALSTGCRLLEIDCWDGPDGEPIVFHGHTATTKILFRDVIKAIKDFGFAASDYSPILTLEMHCSIPQQETITKIFKDVLGEANIAMPVPGTSELPLSPDILKGKFIIRGKNLTGGRIVSGPSSVGSSDICDDETDDSDDEGGAPAEDDKKPEVKHHKVAPELAALTAMPSGKVPKDKETRVKLFEDDRANVNTVSFPVTSVLKVYEKPASLSAMMKWNQKHLAKVYPSGVGVFYNYDPILPWAMGNQMVALNFQTGDIHMQLNHAKFRENGGCGYVMKPAMHLKDLPDLVEPPMNLKVKIISGNRLPKPNESKKGEVIDPYVVVKMFGIKGNNATFTTKHIEDNGFNPIWDEACEFNVFAPSVSMLHVAVYDKDVGKDDFIACYAVPLHAIRPGIRSIPLRNAMSKPIEFASLLMDCTWVC